MGIGGYRGEAVSCCVVLAERVPATFAASLTLDTLSGP
jgi:hypothetical protein